MIIKFKERILTIYDAPHEPDAFKWCLLYDSENEIILNRSLYQDIMYDTSYSNTSILYHSTSQDRPTQGKPRGQLSIKSAKTRN